MPRTVTKHSDLKRTKCNGRVTYLYRRTLKDGKPGWEKTTHRECEECGKLILED